MMIANDILLGALPPPPIEPERVEFGGRGRVRGSDEVEVGKLEAEMEEAEEEEDTAGDEPRPDKGKTVPRRRTSSQTFRSIRPIERLRALLKRPILGNLLHPAFKRHIKRWAQPYLLLF